jgi:hypothetical protein
VSADRDVTRIVRSWLEEGATALPDRVLDTVLDQLPATPQRRAPWPVRRLLQMTMPARIATVAAAVAAIAVIGAIAIPKGGSVGVQPTPNPTPIPSLIPTPSPTASLPPSLPAEGAALVPGVYRIADLGWAPVPFTFSVPAGWQSTGDGIVMSPLPSPSSTPINRDTAKASMFTWIITHVYTDACHWQGALAPAATADQLATLLEHQKGRTASAPTSLTVGGLPATRVDLTVPASLDVSTCDRGPDGSGLIHFWPDPGPDETGGVCCSPPGSTDEVYSLSAAGKTFVVVARHQADSTPTEIADVEGIVSSIQFELPTPSPSASASQAP